MLEDRASVVMQTTLKVNGSERDFDASVRRTTLIVDFGQHSESLHSGTGMLSSCDLIRREYGGAEVRLTN